ncbi:MAG TPA: hypothetical protein VMG82_16470 [Candidatus Sulfotelmatobacter sp.]|nr:hypothetical protein [Candidatus Sulfotelmatobacter sp.]
MSRKKSQVGPKCNIALLNFADSRNGNRMEAEELLNEIDNLALLLQKVRKQTDRIEAAADAIGDAILAHLGADRTGSPRVQRSSRRSVLSIAPRMSARLRILPSRASKLNRIRP